MYALQDTNPVYPNDAKQLGLIRVNSAECLLLPLSCRRSLTCAFLYRLDPQEPPNGSQNSSVAFYYTISLALICYININKHFSAVIMLSSTIGTFNKRIMFAFFSDQSKKKNCISSGTPITQLPNNCNVSANFNFSVVSF